jgi:hypothetical protein
MELLEVLLRCVLLPTIFPARISLTSTWHNMLNVGFIATDQDCIVESGVVVCKLRLQVRGRDSWLRQLCITKFRKERKVVWALGDHRKGDQCGTAVKRASH